MVLRPRVRYVHLFTKRENDMSATVLFIVALIELELYFTHRARAIDTVTPAHVLRRMESRQATARAYSRPVPYEAGQCTAEEWAQRLTRS